METDEDAGDVATRRKRDADSVRAISKQNIESKRIKDEKLESVALGRNDYELRN